jgi:hypothetical protein
MIWEGANSKQGSATLGAHLTVTMDDDGYLVSGDVEALGRAGRARIRRATLILKRYTTRQR